MDGIRLYSDSASRRIDGLSNAEIALLCDIGTFSTADASAEATDLIAKLLAEGFIVPATGDDAARGVEYRLTGKAEKLLTARGVGLNEA
ncbi:MAG: hypothetical protein AB7K04_17075 [Pseudorhodoplanes sp.]